MSNARRYSDFTGRVWETRGNHYMAHLVRDRNGNDVDFDYSAEFTRVRGLYGPLTPIPRNSEDHDMTANRYKDRDGDVWTDQGDGKVTLPGTGGRWSFWGVANTYGPLVDVDTGARYGPGSEMPGDADADDDAVTVGQRAEALTVAVRLSTEVHGDAGHPANVAGMADQFARFILGE